MQQRRRFIVFVGAALLGTVALKLVVLANGDLSPGGNRLGRTKAMLGHWLRNQGFSVELAKDPSPVVLATAGVCRMMIVIASPGGYHRQLVEQRSKGSGTTLRFVYGGQLYAAQPVWRSWLDYQFYLRARDVGILYPNKATFAVVDSGCRSEALPWHDVAKMPVSTSGAAARS